MVRQNWRFKGILSPCFSKAHALCSYPRLRRSWSDKTGDLRGSYPCFSITRALCSSAAKKIMVRQNWRWGDPITMFFDNTRSMQLSAAKIMVRQNWRWGDPITMFSESTRSIQLAAAYKIMVRQNWWWRDPITMFFNSTRSMQLSAA